MRKISEPRRYRELAVAVEFSRMHDDPALHAPIVSDPACARVPIVPGIVAEGGSVPGSLREPARAISHGVVGRISEWTERRVRHVGAVAIDVKLGTRRSVLQIISAAVFRHPGAFHVGGAGLAWLPAGAMILAEALPAMLVRM